jgi:hypothetical protein
MYQGRSHSAECRIWLQFAGWWFAANIMAHSAVHVGAAATPQSHDGLSLNLPAQQGSKGLWKLLQWIPASIIQSYNQSICMFYLESKKAAAAKSSSQDIVAHPAIHPPGVS